MAENLVKEKITQNGYAIGAFIASGSATNCEILSMNGMDFVMIDCEHAETNPETILKMCRACQLYGTVPLVRVYDPDDAAMIRRVVKMGTCGVMAPLIGTASQARKVVEAVKGSQAMSTGDEDGDDLWRFVGKRNNYAESTPFAIVQCESVEAVHNIEEIAAVPGLDCIFIGTGDLSLEMGITFKADSSANHSVDHEQIVQAIDKVLAACRKYNVIAGIVTASAEDAARRINQGFQFVTCMNDLGFFKSHTSQHIKHVRSLVTK